MSSPPLSGQRRPLTIALYALGIVAALPVVATVVLLAIDGHPEGLLCIVAGAAVPLLLWGPFHLLQRARLRRWLLQADADDERVTAKAEITVSRERLPASDPRHPGARDYSVRLVHIST